MCLLGGAWTYQHASRKVACERTKGVRRQSRTAEGVSAVHESMKTVVVLEAQQGIGIGRNE